MQVGVHIGSHRVVPVKLPNVAMAVVYNSDNQPVVLAVEAEGGQVMVWTATDKGFAAVCQQYNITAQEAKDVTGSKQ
jgi:hypothetical protein